MQRVLGRHVFQGSRPCSACRLTHLGQNVRPLSHHHSPQSSSGLTQKPRREADQDHLINPSSLRETLEAVREANRASLIRKVAGDGLSTRLRLPTPQTEHLSWLGDICNVRKPSIDYSQEATIKVRRERRQKRKHRVVTPEVVTGDYAGQDVPLQSQWRLSTSTGSQWRRPWLPYLDPGARLAKADAHIQLTAEIKAFAAYFTPNASEVQAANTAYNDIKIALSSAQPSYSVELMGSRASGLATPLSDLDLNVKSSASSRLDDQQDRNQILESLGNTARQLRKLTARVTEGPARNLKINAFIGSARIPIIRGLHLPTGLEFQIAHTTSGYNSTEYVKSFLHEYSSLRSLFFVLKQMLTMRGLSEGQHGGLTSYPLLNMIVASLKLNSETIEKTDLASHLLAFLDMYSEIDFYTTGISVSPPAYLRLSAADVREPIQAIVGDPAGHSGSSRKASSYRMYLIDPADPSNNLGSNAQVIKHVQATIIQMRQALRQNMQLWHDAAEIVDGPALDDRSLLACLIDGDYKAFQLDRAALEQSKDRRSGSDDDDFMNSMRQWRI